MRLDRTGHCRQRHLAAILQQQLVLGGCPDEVNHLVRVAGPYLLIKLSNVPVHLPLLSGHDQRLLGGRCRTASPVRRERAVVSVSPDQG